MESEVSQTILFKGVTLDNLTAKVKEIYAIGKNYDVWLFHAEMGGGKTTFISHLCDFLKVEDHVSSPTFAIVNEYFSAFKGSIFHFDFYRIKHEQEAFEIGVEDYFYSGNLCLVEWPELIPSFIPERSLSITLEVEEESNSRTIKVDRNG